MPIATMLDLSTAHMPSTSPNFGSCRFVEHEYGFVVFVYGDANASDDIPEWLQPVHDLAVKHECILINFDRDAERDDNLPTWEW